MKFGHYPTLESRHHDLSVCNTGKDAGYKYKNDINQVVLEMREDFNCSELNKFMNGLCIECLVAFLSVLDVIFITTELLIRVDIISDQSTDLASDSNLTDAAEIGSSICRKCVLGSPLDIAYCTSHYASVTIAGLFLIEVFDGFVVLTLCFMEILFTIFWTKVICYNVAIEASTYIVIFRLCRIHRACSVRKRRYAERLENEMHYLRRAKSKAEDHARDLTGKMKKQQSCDVPLTPVSLLLQKELYELNQKLSAVAITYINEERSKSTSTLTDDSKLSAGNGHIPNGVIQAYAENKSTQIVQEAKEEVESGVNKRQNSIQYKSLLSEIENRPRSDILQKATRSKSTPAILDSSSKLSGLRTSPIKDRDSRITQNGHSPSMSMTLNLKKEIENKALNFMREKSIRKSMNSLSDNEKERSMSAVSNTSSTNEADVVRQLEKIVQENETPSPFNSVNSTFSDPSPGSTVKSNMSVHSTETEDDMAVLIRRGKSLVHGHINSAFKKDFDDEVVRMRKDMEVMAEISIRWGHYFSWRSRRPPDHGVFRLCSSRKR
ncbi:hypothetical protein FSP39_019164 [Pinctada imbricata]|uniref:Uncharacterized protein n=1 Tax=Pinctada imbricata TaxID=66713 RepID=A0AA89C405_PINIB|nr:hypothetical protein FSP39_019164 [Pinctada imbricata]